MSSGVRLAALDVFKKNVQYLQVTKFVTSILVITLGFVKHLRMKIEENINCYDSTLS